MKNKMRQTTQHTINRLAAPTWSALQINASSLPLPDDDLRPYQKAPGAQLPAGAVLEHPGAPAGREWPLAVRETAEYASAHAGVRLRLTVPNDAVWEQPAVLWFELDEQNARLTDDIEINAGAGSRATVVLRYTSDEGAQAFHCGAVRVTAQRDADIRVIVAQTLAQDATHADAVAVQAQQNARVSVIFVQLGARQAATACDVVLAGDAAEATLDGVYLVNGSRSLDVNYRIEYRGKNTRGDITLHGALLGSAKKTAKSTLDFVRGASGAKGREEENVLTFSPRAVNLSAPLLLCAEDDVEGQHATSTGRPDAAKLFYLTSRGIAEPEAKKLLALAAFSPVLDKLEPDALREQAVQTITEVMSNEPELC